MLLRLWMLCSVVVGLSWADTKSVQTYKLMGSVGQQVTSSALFWENYYGDAKQLRYAVESGQYVSETESYPIYLCRALVDGIHASGNTKRYEDKTVCTVALQNNVKTHHKFDLLINKGNGAKLSWKPWKKFVQTPTGAVSSGLGGHRMDDNYYVARTKPPGNGHHHSHYQNHVDYVVGRFDPEVLLGRIFVNVGDTETAVEEGEILCETEPVRYELRDIKVDKWRRQDKVNTTELGWTVLQNTESMTNLVESVVSYEFDRIYYWGTYDGVVRGLPTTVYELRKPHEISWGFKVVDKVIETKTVSTNLQPGTAINISIVGEYTKSEGPYTAMLKRYFADNDDPISRPITTTMQMADMTNVKVSFGPVYWIHNMSVVPTTTTTTTTTQKPRDPTTTTDATTTKRKEMVYPGMPPPLDDLDENELPADQSQEADAISRNVQQMSPEELQKANIVKGNEASASGSHRISWSATLFVLLLTLSSSLF